MEEEGVIDYGNANYRPFNRGNKLKRRAPDTHGEPSLHSIWTPFSIEESTKYAKIGNRRVIVPKDKRKDDQTDDDEIYGDIDLEEIWMRPEKVEDIKRNKSYLRTLRGRELKVLSDAAMEMIEDESKHLKIVRPLMVLLQEDDPALEHVKLGENVPEEALTNVRDLVMQNISFGNEMIKRLSDIRIRLHEAYTQKKELATQLGVWRRRRHRELKQRVSEDGDDGV
ncbi:hypothetical protein BJ742DRAFT_785937 [Cladochytrium replicatum]|nr:hypothetical protein BJ742DRAFT_785937 [Cladochytrium replicatum]